MFVRRKNARYALKHQIAIDSSEADSQGDDCGVYWAIAKMSNFVEALATL